MAGTWFNYHGMVQAMRDREYVQMVSSLPEGVLPAGVETDDQYLVRRIAEKREFIAQHPNYRWLCAEAQRYIEWAQNELAKRLKETVAEWT